MDEWSQNVRRIGNSLGSWGCCSKLLIDSSIPVESHVIDGELIRLQIHIGNRKVSQQKPSQSVSSKPQQWCSYSLCRSCKAEVTSCKQQAIKERTDDTLRWCAVKQTAVHLRLDGEQQCWRTLQGFSCLTLELPYILAVADVFISLLGGDQGP